MSQTDASFREKDRAHYLQVYDRVPVTLSHGKGSRVWDLDGNEYIDALAGIAVNSLGHCHPDVVEAIREQAGNLIHVSNFYLSIPQAKLTEKLVELSGLDRAFFINSGSESVETAIKLARKQGHKKGRGGHIISMEGCFHGRSLGTIAAGKKAYQKGFEPIPEGFTQVPFHDIQAIEDAIEEKTCAVILEPVQGEGGIRPADRDHLQAVRKLCDDHGLLLILDEIQCGIGRTGTFFAHENAGIQPDILCLAKALGGGVPIGATLCTQEVADAISYGEHGTTFGGNPLACAAGLAAVQAVLEEGLPERAKSLGDRTMKDLNELAKERDDIEEVRGRGLMIGVAVTKDAKAVVQRMREQGVLSNVTAGKVIRLVPPLNIPEADLRTIVQSLRAALDEVSPS